MEKSVFERGQVWYLDLANSYSDNIATGRPVLVLSSKVDCERNDYLQVAVMTKQGKGQVVNVPVRVGGVSGYVQCNNINSIERSRLRDLKGKLSESHMADVERGIKIALGMEVKEQPQPEAPKESKDETDLIVERDMYKRLYERALEKLVESAYGRETRAVESPRAAVEPPVVEQPKRTVRVLTDDVDPDSEEPVDVNACSVADLRRIGLSATVSNNMVELRPYASKDELREVPGMTAKMFNIVRDRVVVNAVAAKLNINTCRRGDLINAGINSGLADRIMSMRKELGALESLDDLLSHRYIGRKSVDKLREICEV